MGGDVHIKELFFATLCLVAIMGVVAAAGPSASVEARQAPSTPPVERTGDAAVGASIVHPKELSVDRERYTYDGTYGFTLWEPEEDPLPEHGGTPTVRVALAYNLKPGQIERRVDERIAEHPDVKMERETVAVGEKKLKGVAVGPIPGSTPSTEVYVAVEGRVYQINLYFEGPGQVDLDDDDRMLLSGLRFERPSRSVSSLGLKNGKAPETYYRKGNSEPSAEELRERRAGAPGGRGGRPAGG